MSGRDVFPTINLEVLIFPTAVGAVMDDEQALGKEGRSRAIGDGDAVGVVDVVDFAAFGIDREDEVVRSLAVIDFEFVAPLAGGDQIAAAIGGVINRQAFDVGFQTVTVIADLGDESAIGTAVRLSAEFPDAGSFFGDEEVAQLVVGHAAFGGGFEFQCAHLGAGDRAGFFTKQILFNRTVFVIHEEVVLAGAGAAIGAASIGGAAFEDFDDAVGRDVGQIARGGVDGPDFDARCVRGARASDGKVRRFAAQNKAVEDIDVVGLAGGGDQLMLGAIDVVTMQAALLVGAEDEALGGIGGMDPDGRVVGGVTFVWDGIGLGAGLGTNNESIIRNGGDQERNRDGDAEDRCGENGSTAHGSNSTISDAWLRI